MIIVKTKIKELVGDFNVAGDFPETLNREVEEMIKKACERAKANARKTVMGKDL